MKAEEFIEKLRNVQRTLDSVKDDLDRAIDRMQRRIETGYESMERSSRLAALAGREYVKLADSTLLEVGTAKIEYTTTRNPRKIPKSCQNCDLLSSCISTA